nr:hypothetical protein [Tanacetum cinerariifolium]
AERVLQVVAVAPALVHITIGPNEVAHVRLHIVVARVVHRGTVKPYPQRHLGVAVRSLPVVNVVDGVVRLIDVVVLQRMISAAATNVGVTHDASRSRRPSSPSAGRRRRPAGSRAESGFR